ncbi:MAG: DUF3261 domain-containing protein [Fibrobacteraceae bacterium]|nr:DUF3261 domain-containing protein [Fibrobacteraceae bacterium]
MKFFWVLSTVLPFLLLASCTSKSIRSHFAPVYLTNDKSISILPVNATAHLGQSTQHLEGQYGEKSFTADAYIDASDSSFDIFIASGFGTTLAQLRYTQDSVSFTSSVFDTKKMQAEYVIADFQICFADAQLLKNHFASFGLTFEETPGGNPAAQDFERKIYDDKNLIMTVTKKNNQLKLINSLRNYSYLITVSQ